jgi:hypothetical protein
MEVHVINSTTNRTCQNKRFSCSLFFPQILQNRVKIKYNFNPKIHTRSCVYTFIDNEARKINNLIKIP